jgi:hypothetical protein
MIRPNLASLALGLLLGVLLAATGAGAGGGEALGHTYRYDLVQIVQNTVLSGGSDQATDATSHDTVTLTGSGQFKPGPGDATGGGTFVHQHADGTVVAHGVWVVTGFVSWQNLGGSLAGTGLTNGIAHNGDETGGIVTLNVSIMPASGSPHNATLVVQCNLPGASPPTTEGVVLNSGPFHFTPSGGATVFDDIG